MTADDARHIAREQRVADFDVQIALWGADWTGDVTEFSAMVVENPEWGVSPMGGALWDRTVRWLGSVQFFDRGRREPAPPHWCLPWVTEWRLRREMADA